MLNLVLVTIYNGVVSVNFFIVKFSFSFIDCLGDKIFPGDTMDLNWGYCGGNIVR